MQNICNEVRDPSRPVKTITKRPVYLIMFNFTLKPMGHRQQCSPIYVLYMMESTTPDL